MHPLFLHKPASNGTVEIGGLKWFLITIADSAVDTLAVSTAVDIQVEESRGESVALKTA